MYKLSKSYDGTVCVRKDCDNGLILLIPQDPANTDYQEYLKWVSEGNEPLPAENE